MIRQKSYIDEKATLYLVPTPIGNFSDMTYRAVEILNSVDIIFCEDTRVTKVLLSHFNINTKLSSYHIFNEEVKADEIISLLEEGKLVALVSDAGLPCISDPGFLISKKAIEKGFNVISLPGANAALTALVASGLPSEKFYFHGFLPSKQGQRQKEIASLKDINYTIIFYEAPHRILSTLSDMLEVLGNREVVVGRELTKKFEEYIRGNLEDIVSEIGQLKGEIVIVLKGNDKNIVSKDLENLSIKEHYNYYINEGLDEKEAMKKVASDRKVSKSEVYKEVKVN